VYLLAQRTVGRRSGTLLTRLGVRGQLREHAYQSVRDRLAVGGGRGLHELHDRIHGHAIGRLVHERVAPGGVAAHAPNDTGSGAPVAAKKRGILRA
jgi:hypothetical protein